MTVIWAWVPGLQLHIKTAYSVNELKGMEKFIIKMKHEEEE